MQERRNNIINDLINAVGYVTSFELAKKYNVVARTIRYDIQAINKQLKECNAYIESDTHHGYMIDESNKQKILKYLDKHFYELEDYFPTKSVHRQAYIALLLLFSNQSISLDTMAQNLYVAKSTAKLDMDKVLLVLQDMYVTIKHNNKGTYIVSSEERRRLLASYFLMYYIEEPRMICVILAMIIKIDLMESYNTLIRSIAEGLIKYNQKAKDVSIALFAIKCLISKVRVEQGFEFNRIESIKHEVVSYIIEKTNPIFSLPESEWKVLEYEFINRTLGRIDAIDGIEAKSVLYDFYDISYNEYALMYSEEDKEILERQVTKIIAKSRKSIMEKNIYTQEIIQKYPFAFEVALNLRGLIHNTNKYIPIDDIATITLLVDNALRENEDVIKIVIISELGDIVLNNLKKKIENVIEHKRIELSLQSQYEINYLLEQNTCNFDLVIATNEKLKSKVEKYGIDYIYISPFLHTDDIQRLNKRLIATIKKRNERIKNIILSKLSNDIFFQEMDTIDDYKDRNLIPIRHAFYIRDKILAVRINRQKNYINIIKLNTIFNYLNHDVTIIVAYSSNGETYSGINLIYMIIELFAKKVKAKEIMAAKNKDEVINVLLNTDFY